MRKSGKGRNRGTAPVISIDAIRNRSYRGVPPMVSDHSQAPGSQVSTEEDGAGELVVQIYDGMARWWRIRKFQVMGALLLCIGIIVGMVILELLRVNR